MVNPIDQAIQDFLPPKNISLEDYLLELQHNIVEQKQKNEIIDQSLVNLINGAWLLKKSNPENKSLLQLKKFVEETFEKLDEPTQQSIRQYVNRFKSQYNFDNGNGDSASSMPGRPR